MDHVVLQGAGGEHENHRGDASLAELLAQRVAVSVRQHDIAPDLGFGVKATFVETGDLAIGNLLDARLDFAEATPERSRMRAAALLEVILWSRALLRVNLGLDVLNTELSETAELGFGYGGELSYGVGGSWLLFAGATGVTGDETALSIEPGVSHALTDRLELGVAGSLGATDAAPGSGGGMFLRWRQ